MIPGGRFLLKLMGYQCDVTDVVDMKDGDEVVIALEPAQIGALIALAVAVILIWRAVRRSN